MTQRLTTYKGQYEISMERGGHVFPGWYPGEYMVSRIETVWGRNPNTGEYGFLAEYLQPVYWTYTRKEAIRLYESLAYEKLPIVVHSPTGKIVRSSGVVS
jgi:hypothetical protein